MKQFAVLALIFAAQPVLAADSWSRVSSEHFQIAGTFNRKEMRNIAAELELFRWGFLQFFDLPDSMSTPPTRILVFRNEREFLPYKPVYNGRPAGIAGYFQKATDKDDSTHYIVLSAAGGARHVLYHEYVHTLTSSNFAGLPLWFQEGFAECFSTIEFEGNSRIKIGRAVSDHIVLLNRKRFMPLERLFAVTHASAEYNEANGQKLLYAQSWALVHYLMLGDGGRRRSKMPEFLTGLRNQEPVAQLVPRIFGTDLPTFERAFEGYIRERIAWPILEVTAPMELEAGKGLSAQSLPESEMELWLGELLLQSDRLSEAEGHLENAVRLDPSMAAAHIAVGKLRLRQNRRGEALPHFSRAIDLDPEEPRAHYYFALAIPAGERPAEAEWRRMQPSLLKAVELAPDFAAAREMLADTTRKTDTPAWNPLALRRSLVLLPTVLPGRVH